MQSTQERISSTSCVFIHLRFILGFPPALSSHSLSVCVLSAVCVCVCVCVCAVWSYYCCYICTLHCSNTVNEQVEYARVRGVQIMLEIDMPGHSFAFGVGYPELLVNSRTSPCSLCPLLHSCVILGFPSVLCAVFWDPPLLTLPDLLSVCVLHYYYYYYSIGTLGELQCDVSARDGVLVLLL